MKSVFVLFLSLLMLLLCGCAQTGGVVVATQSEQPTKTAVPTAASAVQEPSTPAPEPAVSPVSGDAPKMYTNLAHMTAFDPNTGIASFDYFDMLRGDDAVQWLVEQEGYSKADAQAQVSAYTDSEYIEKNTNTQLRMVDLSTVPVTLVVNDDGTLNSDSRTVSLDILKALYASSPDLLLKTFFFEVKVSTDGQIESVSQVYWP